MIKKNSGKLDLLIKKHYGRDINIQNLTRRAFLPVSPGPEHSALVTEFMTGGDVTQDLELVQELLDDLCRQGVLREDDYFIWN